MMKMMWSRYKKNLDKKFYKKARKLHHETKK